MSETNEAVIIEDEALETESEVEAEESAFKPEDEIASVLEESAEDAANDEEAEEVIVSIGEEAPPPDEYQKAPQWVRELRKQHRELQRKNRELEARLQTTQTETKPVEVGRKPTLEDHDYDAEKFENALAAWYERKRLADAEAEKRKQAEQAQHQAWQERLTQYGHARAELRVRDYEDAESAVQELFNVTQQGVILQGAENAALVVYALGKNPKKAAELAKIDDPVKFAFAVAKLEKDLKVSNRKATPAPERQINATGRVSGAMDSTLERLRAEAEKTGNYTKVLQYKRQKRAAS